MFVALRRTVAPVTGFGQGVWSKGSYLLACHELIYHLFAILLIEVIDALRSLIPDESKMTISLRALHFDSVGRVSKATEQTASTKERREGDCPPFPATEVATFRWKTERPLRSPISEER